MAIVVFSVGSVRAEDHKNQANNPWCLARPLRIVEFVNDIDGNFGTESLDQELKKIQESGGNVQHFHCMSLSADAEDTGGVNEKRFFFKTTLSQRDNPDRLAPYLPLAHQHDIRVVVYVNVHAYSRGFGETHPDWRQIKEDGSPLSGVYQTQTSCCVNSLYREWVFQILRDLCRYDIDGIFFDGPIFFEQTCYCPACKKLFKERTGRELPPKSDRASPLWGELVEFQADSLARFLADSDKVIKAINPQILLYMNGNSHWPYWPTGQVLWSYYGRLQGCYEHTPVISDMPFLVENHFGKGKAFYVAGTFGGSLSNDRFPEYLSLVRNIVAQTAPPPVTLEEAPEVEISWRQSGDTHYLHLINETGRLKRPWTGVQPVRDVKVRLNFRDRSARALQADVSLPVREDAENSWFVLPELRDYEVVAIEP